MNDIYSRVTQKVHDTIARAKEVYGVEFPTPTIRFDLRGTTAGKAYYNENAVNFNTVLLLQNTETFLARTVPHEVAHLVTRKVYPFASAHGREWRSVMSRLGVQDITRCHSYDTSSSVVRVHQKFDWVCGCGVAKVGRKVNQKMLMGFNYRCRKCGVRLHK